MIIWQVLKDIITQNEYTIVRIGSWGILMFMGYVWGRINHGMGEIEGYEQAGRDILGEDYKPPSYSPEVKKELNASFTRSVIVFAVFTVGALYISYVSWASDPVFSLMGLGVLVVGYISIGRLIMKGRKSKADEAQGSTENTKAAEALTKKEADQ